MGLKCAAPGKNDWDRLLHFFKTCEQIFEHNTMPPITIDGWDDEEKYADFPSHEDVYERLECLWGVRFGHSGIDCIWTRMLFGFMAMYEGACDQDSDVLEFRTELQAMAGVAEKAGDLHAKLEDAATTLSAMSAMIGGDNTPAMQRASDALGEVMRSLVVLNKAHTGMNPPKLDQEADADDK